MRKHFNTHMPAARPRLSLLALSLSGFYCYTATADNLPLTAQGKQSETLVVTGVTPKIEANNKVVVSAQQM